MKCRRYPLVRRAHCALLATGNSEGRLLGRGKLGAVTTDLLERIIVDPAICFGKPTIRRHRLWVSLILGHLAEGWTVDAALAEFPQLEVDDVRACIAYGARLADVPFADLDAVMFMVDPYFQR